MRLERVICRDSGCSVGLRLRRITDVRNAQVDVATLKGLQIWLSIIGDCRRTKGGWVEGRVAVCVINKAWCASGGRIAWRRNTLVIERQRNDLVASDVFDIATFDRQIVARLPLNVDRLVECVRF